MRKYVLLIIIIGLLMLISACSKNANSPLQKEKITIFKSPTCGCCVGWESYAKDQGFSTELKMVEDIDSVKDEYSIPAQLRSCHTAKIGDYFVEGHVPIEAINKLLSEKPDIDGIALPGMPSGSAGMPGKKNEEWIIYSIKDGNYAEFMRI